MGEVWQGRFARTPGPVKEWCRTAGMRALLACLVAAACGCAWTQVSRGARPGAEDPPAVQLLAPGEEAPSWGVRSGSMVSSSAARRARAAERGERPPAALAPPSPEAADAIALAVGKTLLYEDPSTHERFYRVDLS